MLTFNSVLFMLFTQKMPKLLTTGALDNLVGDICF